MLGSTITFNGHTINNHLTQPLLQAQAPFYYISVMNVDGLYTSDVSYESHPLPNLTGEKSGDVFRRGKTITLSGNITGHTYSYLLNGIDYLGSMFATTALSPLAWTRQNDGVAVFINCRVQQDLSVVESLNSLLPRFSWVIGLRADDPRSYAVSGGALHPSWQ